MKHAWLALLLAACADEGSSAPPTLELGTGEWAFEPLSEGQQVRLVAGTQGGFHVWLSMRAQGFDGTRLRMKLQLIPSSAPDQISGSDLELAFQPGDDGLEFIGWPAQLLMPWCFTDAPLTLDVELSEGDTRSAHASIAIVPTPPVNGFTQACAR